MLALPVIAVAAPPVSKPVLVPAAAWRAADEAWDGGDFLLARSLTAELVQKFPDEPSLWLRLGEIEQRRGDFAAALLAYDSALGLARDGGPLVATTRFKRAELLLQEADRELAASGTDPLLGGVVDRREPLRRSLDFARGAGLLEERAKPARSDVRARGYVVEPGAAK
jgi:tetratricopeptide (TPR) repeat protein